MKALATLLILGLCASSLPLPAQEEPALATPAPAEQPAAPAADQPASEQPAAVAPGAVTPAPATEGVDSAIPQPFPDDRYQTTWSKNPFLIKVVAKEQATASFSEDWELKGIVERGGVQIAFLGSKKDPSAFKRVGPTPDADGFQLVSANPSRNRKEAKVTVSKGGETAEFVFSDTPTAPQPGAGVAPPRPGVVPGQPAPMRQPIVPGQPARTVQPTAAVPGQPVPGQPVAPPSAVARRRVLIPSPVPPPSGNP